MKAEQVHETYKKIKARQPYSNHGNALKPDLHSNNK